MPGWPTMHALTRGLQIELGITALSDAFGPSTLKRLIARGGVQVNDPNANLVRIVQCACYVKGYRPAAISGALDLSTQVAVGRLMQDAGIDGFQDAVTPKVLKALLTMDSYVVAEAGSPPIRRMQRWLNATYLDRANFFLVPCDGVFSREVQKALYLALQFQFGMSDTQATGVFGPGTREGLRSVTIRPGESSNFVNIFTAAMVVNHIYAPDGSRFENFSAAFDTAAAEALRGFQQFSAIPITGIGDYATWCQLLLSTGDAERPGSASDTSTAVTDARAQALSAAGYRIVGRYLENVRGGLNKQIQPGELATMFRNDLRVFPISQYDGSSLDYFTYERGYQDGLAAHTAALGHGFDPGTTIYFAVDYDATQADLDASIVPYFTGVAGALASRGRRYVHGVYGARNVCTQVTARTSARWAFVSGMSYGFVGNMGHPLPDNWAFNQIQTLTIGSSSAAEIEIDKNVSRPRTDPGVDRINSVVASADSFIAYLRRLHTLARSYDAAQDPNLRVLEFLLHEDHAGGQWPSLLGVPEQPFVQYIKDQGVEIIRQFRLPDTEIDLNVGHFAAACTGVQLYRPTGAVSNRGDLVGWGGDLIAFYGEWRRNTTAYASGYTFCVDRFAKTDGNGTFQLPDLIADADGHNVALTLSPTLNLADALARTYAQDDYRTRLRRFRETRFGSDNATVRVAARHILVPGDDRAVNTHRTYLAQTTGGIAVMPGHLLPGDQLDSFCAGFADRLLALVEPQVVRVPQRPSRGRL